MHLGDVVGQVIKGLESQSLGGASWGCGGAGDQWGWNRKVWEVHLGDVVVEIAVVLVRIVGSGG